VITTARQNRAATSILLQAKPTDAAEQGDRSFQLIVHHFGQRYLPRIVHCEETSIHHEIILLIGSELPKPTDVGRRENDGCFEAR